LEKKNFVCSAHRPDQRHCLAGFSREGTKSDYFMATKRARHCRRLVAKSKDWEKDFDWAGDILFSSDTLGQGEKSPSAAQRRKESNRRHTVLRPTFQEDGSLVWAGRTEEGRSEYYSYGEFVSFDDAVDQ